MKFCSILSKNIKRKNEKTKHKQKTTNQPTKTPPKNTKKKYIIKDHKYMRLRSKYSGQSQNCGTLLLQKLFPGIQIHSNWQIS